jgi:hypothetical protein
MLLEEQPAETVDEVEVGEPGEHGEQISDLSEAAQGRTGVVGADLGPLPSRTRDCVDTYSRVNRPRSPEQASGLNAILNVLRC